MEFLGSFCARAADARRNAGAEFVADFSINAVRRLGIAEGRSLPVDCRQSACASSRGG